MSNWASMKVVREVLLERLRQDEKFGEQNHRDGTGLWGDEDAADAARAACDENFRYGNGTWRDVLAEEFNEALAESDPDKLRAELIQVAAVAVAWAEAIDRRRP
ncbi:hypothetical protein [Amycolatopsis sp.]|uniref:hypothetical protein n=1 Tax=Amycolatopsis sp. TaxID=37632 RepID=UPI002BE5C058|nr:hypothetical protein [Amycolatopsis sp.]HVV11625.1 hypothetical protein [Amycolatopsis sp.]